jgi:hypothetical protein
MATTDFAKESEVFHKCDPTKCSIPGPIPGPANAIPGPIPGPANAIPGRIIFPGPFPEPSPTRPITNNRPYSGRITVPDPGHILIPSSIPDTVSAGSTPLDNTSSQPKVCFESEDNDQPDNTDTKKRKKSNKSNTNKKNKKKYTK